MKSWRLGTFSMGASLVFLGIFLVLTPILHWNAAGPFYRSYLG
ncbi:hypothetical protein [Heyndrickxia vini]|nr:hypothetical protein [Heyndrickxia vini]